MVEINQIQRGLANFIDRDIIPKLSAWERIVVGGGGGLIAAKMPEVLAAVSQNPVVNALGVVDAERGEIDIDAIYEAARPYIGADPIPVKIPVIGVTLRLTAAEIERLYTYIKEA